MTIPELVWLYSHEHWFYIKLIFIHNWIGNALIRYPEEYLRRPYKYRDHLVATIIQDDISCLLFKVSTQRQAVHLTYRGSTIPNTARASGMIYPVPHIITTLDSLSFAANIKTFRTISLTPSMKSIHDSANFNDSTNKSFKPYKAIKTMSIL